MYEREVQAAIPKPSRGRRFLAAALLEAPSANGPWTAIEAVPIPTPEDPVPDTLSTKSATLNPGWYRIQWYDDGQNSKYSPPVKVQDGDASASGRWA